MARNKFDTADCLADINGEDIIDTRDLRDLLDNLQEKRDDHAEWVGTDPVDRQGDEPDALTEDEGELLKVLEELENDVSEWRHGEALIRDSYFEDYARQMAEDIGAMPKDSAWPVCHIDWEAATDALKQDYSSVDIGGVEYWYRSC